MDIDMLVEVPVLSPQTLAAAADGEPSAQVAQRVRRARERALARQGCLNHGLTPPQLDQHGRTDPAAMALLHKAATRLAWSARSYHRVLRIARSIADLDDSDALTPAHMAEAVQWRRALPQS